MSTITLQIVNCHSGHKTWSWYTDAQSCQWTKSWDHSVNIHSSPSIACSFILKLPSYALIIDLPRFSTIILNLFLTLLILAARWDHILPDLSILSLLDDLYNQWSPLFYNIVLINCSVPCFYFRFCHENFYVNNTCGFVSYETKFDTHTKEHTKLLFTVHIEYICPHLQTVENEHDDVGHQSE
jgi:hypothetical protein